MKTYEGHPGAPGRITVREGKGKAKPIKFRPTHTPPTITWAPNDLSLAWIALAILDDYLDQPDRALRLMQRFKWRIAPNWKPGIAWSLSEEEVKETIADIEAVERQTAPARRMVALEPTPVVSDRASDIEWSKEPKLKRNIVGGNS